MEALEIISSAVVRIAELMALSLGLIKSIIYTDNHLNIFGYLLLIVIFITVLEMILNISFNKGVEDDEED